MEIESKPTVNYTLEYFVAAGYIVFFCTLVFACLGLFSLNRSVLLPHPSPTNEFAEKLPPTTPIPHISSNGQFEADSILFEEEFNSNQNRWLNSQDETKEKIQDGKLFFQSRNEGEYSSISCETCPSLKTPYYLEASLSTNQATEEAYGIVFNRSYTFDDYFLFMINAEAMRYFLFHHTSDGWTLRTSGTSSQIQPYPESTLLGIYANKDLLELYINGVIVDSYVESGSSFHPGFFGLYINDSWFGVYADRIVIYEMGE